MKTGDEVYLCENIFCKFRELNRKLHSVDENIFYKSVASSLFVKNEFIVIAVSKDKTIISIKDFLFDTDLVRNLSFRLMQTFPVEHCYLGAAYKFDILCYLKSLSNYSYNCLVQKIPEKINSVFVVPTDKLTLIDQIKK